jgi:sec-independent protein translocase protein TatA
MFGIGIPELVIIIIVALLVVGPSKLPDLARSMGKALGEFRRLADDVKETIEQEMAKEPEKEEETQKEAQKEEQKEEQQKAEGETIPGEQMMYDAHMVADDGQRQEQVAEETPMSQGLLFAGEGLTQGQKEEQQRAEGETTPVGLQVAGQEKEKEKEKEKAEKVAEGISVNEPQKT